MHGTGLSSLRQCPWNQLQHPDWPSNIYRREVINFAPQVQISDIVAHDSWVSQVWTPLQGISKKHSREKPYDIQLTTGVSCRIFLTTMYDDIDSRHNILGETVRTTHNAFTTASSSGVQQRRTIFKLSPVEPCLASHFAHKSWWRQHLYSSFVHERSNYGAN